jgi:acyl carrier protein
MYDELGVKVTPNDFKELNSIADLIKLAGDKVE